MAERILVADDDANNRRIMTIALTRAGYEVVLAADGGETLASVAREAPDLVLLDLAMPVVSGWEVVRLLKADLRLRRIPVIAFTALAMSGDEQRALEAGCDAYLSKPCAARDAVAAVRSALAARA